MLGLVPDSSPEEIRAAYRKRALQLHPDRNRGKEEESKERFQHLQKVYEVLIDPKKREVYDRTGSLEDAEDLVGESFDRLYEYYRTQYREVTEEDVRRFECKYRGSEEERSDLYEYYVKFRGRMDKVFAWLMCSRPELDSHRFRDWIEEGCMEGKLKRYPEYTKWSRRVSKRSAPETSRVLVPNRKVESNEQDLFSIIRSRSEERSNKLLDSIASKYVGKEIPPPPEEEELVSARERIRSRKRQRPT